MFTAVNTIEQLVGQSEPNGLLECQHWVAYTSHVGRLFQWLTHSRFHSEGGSFPLTYPHLLSHPSKGDDPPYLPSPPLPSFLYFALSLSATTPTTLLIHFPSPHFTMDGSSLLLCSLLLSTQSPIFPSLYLLQPPPSYISNFPTTNSQYKVYPYLPTPSFHPDSPLHLLSEICSTLFLIKFPDPSPYFHNPLGPARIQLGKSGVTSHQTHLGVSWSKITKPFSHTLYT